MLPAETHTMFSTKPALWASYIMATVPILLLLMSGVMKVMAPPFVAEGFVHLGYPESLTLGIGIIELLCVILYFIPPTAALGTIYPTPATSVTGAIVTHLRVGEPVFVQIALGTLIWLGLYLREQRLTALIPLRTHDAVDFRPPRSTNWQEQESAGKDQHR